MYDEHGYHYIPRPTRRPKPSTPPPSKVEAAQDEDVKRPLWLNLAVNLVLLTAFMRFCSPLPSDRSGFILIQFASSGVLLVNAIGLLGMRRWAMRFFVLLCAWSFFSALAVMLNRLSYLDQIESLSQRDMVLLSVLRDGIIGTVFYGMLGIVFFFNRHHFQAVGENRYGNVPFALMFGVLVLFTAVQMADAPANVVFRAQMVEESQGLMNNWFR